MLPISEPKRFVFFPALVLFGITGKFSEFGCTHNIWALFIKFNDNGNLRWLRRWRTIGHTRIAQPDLIPVAQNI